MAELIQLTTLNPPCMPDMVLPDALLLVSGIQIVEVSGLASNRLMVIMKCEFSGGT